MHITNRKDILSDHKYLDITWRWFKKIILGVLLIMSVSVHEQYWLINCYVHKIIFRDGDQYPNPQIRDPVSAGFLVKSRIRNMQCRSLWKDRKTISEIFNADSSIIFLNCKKYLVLFQFYFSFRLILIKFFFTNLNYLWRMENGICKIWICNSKNTQESAIFFGGSPSLFIIRFLSTSMTINIGWTNQFQEKHNLSFLSLRILFRFCRIFIENLKFQVSCIKAEFVLKCKSDTK